MDQHIDATTSKNYTTFDQAAADDSIDIIELLLHSGAQVGGATNELKKCTDELTKFKERLKSKVEGNRN